MNNQFIRRTDSMLNVATGIGKKNRDKTMNTTVQADDILADEELSTCYREGLVSTIVDTIPDDGTKKGWLYKNDEKKKIKDKLESLKFTQALNKAWKYMRIYRGSLIVMISNVELDMPLAPSEDIRQLRIYSAARINLTSIDIVTDPKSPYFEEVEFYKVRLKNGTEIKVHASRCLVFKGELPPDDDTELDVQYRYWGLSTIQKTWTPVQWYLSSMQGVANIMQELILGKYKMENLSQIMSMNNSDAIEKIMLRLEAMSLSKSILNAVMIGANDEYTRDSANLAGAGDILDRMGLLICCVSGYPFTKLFGRSPAGENATGEGDRDNYIDNVASDQQDVLKPVINKLAAYVGLQVYGGSPEDYGVERFNSIEDPNEKEVAETNKINADVDQIYLMNGIVDAEYIQEKRFPDFVEGGE